MTNAELEAKVHSVTDEVNFLKALYDAVSLPLTHLPPVSQRKHFISLSF